MTDTGPAGPVTTSQIADLLAQARALSQARSAADPAARSSYLTAKAALLARITGDIPLSAPDEDPR